MGKLKVLLVSYVFPPAGGVGTLRAASFARYFPQEGIHLDVLTTRNASSVGRDQSQLRGIDDEVTIHRTLTLDLPFRIRKWIKRIASDAGAPQKGLQGKDGTSKSGILKSTLQRVLRPDPQVTWLPVLSRVARNIIAKKKVDIVLITAPPFSSLLLAPKLRKQFPYLKIVLDFRDEWIKTTFENVSFVFNTGEKDHALARKIEENAIKAADAVVAVTLAARKELRARYPDGPDSKFYLVPNGHDAEQMAPIASAPTRPHRNKVHVCYLGSIYTSTQPLALVQALQSLPPGTREQYRIRFIGHIEVPQYREALLQLGDMVELQGYVPQQEALQALYDTDYVLLINHDPLNVAGKFYDYIGSRRPILGVVHPEGETRRLMDELHAGWWAGHNDVAGIRQLFIDAAARASCLANAFHPDTEKIAQYERKVLARSYATLLRSIAGENNMRGPADVGRKNAAIGA